MIWTIHTPLRFHIFSVSHFVGLAVGIIAVICLLITMRGVSQIIKRALEIIFALSALFIPIIYIYWLYDVDLFNIKSGLPLQVCSISLLLCGLALLTNQQLFICLAVCLGMPSAVGALIFPDITFDFPHFRYYEFFISHFLIIFVCLYYILIKNVIIRYKDMVISLGLFLFYGIAIVIVNNCLHSNYLYIARNWYKQYFRADFLYYLCLIIMITALFHFVYFILILLNKFKFLLKK